MRAGEEQSNEFPGPPMTLWYRAPVTCKAKKKGTEKKKLGKANKHAEACVCMCEF